VEFYFFETIQNYGKSSVITEICIWTHNYI